MPAILCVKLGQHMWLHELVECLCLKTKLLASRKHGGEVLTATSPAVLEFT